MSKTLALARANLSYWPTVAPVVHEQLAHWEARAAAIQDPQLRALALGKLRAERFNPQLAATLATQAPRTWRRTVTEAIVALQVAYDYVDVLGEQGQCAEKDGYAQELLACAGSRLIQLPGAEVVEQTMRRAGERCAQAQALSHAATGSGDKRLRRWACEQADGTSLGWVEWLAGAQASVLGLHALIAAAATDDTSRADAEALDRLYLSIGALTMLDSLIDRDEDLASGEHGFVHWYRGPEQMGECLAAVARDAVQRARGTRGGAHHTMTLTGVAAYYASAPAARDPGAREVFARVKTELGGALMPALAVMWAWRLGKRITSAFSRIAGGRSEQC